MNSGAQRLMRGMAVFGCVVACVSCGGGTQTGEEAHVTTLGTVEVTAELVEIPGELIDRPMYDYAHCGSQQLADIAVQTLGNDKKALLLANHGLIALGKDIPEALKVSYIVEKTAMISIYATVLGTPHSLSPEDVSFLNQSFKSYGQKK